MKETFLMKRLVGLEYLFAAVFVGIFFVSVLGFSWYWLPLLFFVVDASAFGYLQNPKAGALTYNIGHSIIGPTVLIALFILQGHDWAIFAGLIWLFHILVDRALGFGLKHSTSFKHTHLGVIGKTTKK